MAHVINVDRTACQPKSHLPPAHEGDSLVLLHVAAYFRASFPNHHVPFSWSTLTNGAIFQIASLGNPPPLHLTLHSAGNIVLRSLSQLAIPAHWHLFPSPSFMNVSGPPIIAAYNQWLRTLPYPEARKEARLVVIHDELEGKLGHLKMRVGGSARGHNGIKSLVGAGGERLGADGRGTMVRIGVGIGRPASRESEDVSDWVLRHMTAKEKGVLGSEAVRKGILEMVEGL